MVVGLEVMGIASVPSHAGVRNRDGNGVSGGNDDDGGGGRESGAYAMDGDEACVDVNEDGGVEGAEASEGGDDDEDPLQAPWLHYLVA